MPKLLENRLYDAILDSLDSLRQDDAISDTVKLEKYEDLEQELTDTIECLRDKMEDPKVKFE